LSKHGKTKQDWEHVYTQYKNASRDPVLCMMNKETKKFIYFDVKLNRMLSKQEAMIYRPDVTGIHFTHP